MEIMEIIKDSFTFPVNNLVSLLPEELLLHCLVLMVLLMGLYQ